MSFRSFLILSLVTACGGGAAPAPRPATAPAAAPATAPTATPAPAPEASTADAPDAAQTHPPHELGHHFTNAEKWSKRFDNPERDAWQKPAEVVAAMKIAPGMTVADVGAGTGYFMKYLSDAVGPKGTVLELDIEPDMVRFLGERAKKNNLTNVKAQQVKVDDPVLPAGGVDRILIVDTWHHIPDRGAYAAKLAAALRPGGAVYVVDFPLDAPHGPPPPHRLAPKTVIDELTAGGLTASQLPEDLPNQYIIEGRKQ